MNIEVKEGVVFKDGEEVGTYSGGNFLAGKFIHHKTASAISKALANQHLITGSNGGKGDKPVKLTGYIEQPPEQDPNMGDKTPEYVEWFRANHSAEEFQAKYAHRKIS